MRARAEFAPGEVVEIETSAGLAYVQVAHRHQTYPETVRALPGLHRSRPADPAALAGRPARFTAMIPLAGAVARLGLRAEVVATAPVPEAERRFPTFRMPVRDKQGDVAYWWLWDGDGLTYAVGLSDEQAGLPMREVMSAERFLERLCGPGRAEAPGVAEQ